MNLTSLKNFAIESRKKLMHFVADKIAFVLAPESAARRSTPDTVRKLEEAIAKQGKMQVIEATAYMWFNRFCALRFMDANHYTAIGVVTPAEGATRPEILAEAIAGNFDLSVNDEQKRRVQALLNGETPSNDRFNDAYRILFIASCNAWAELMPFMFEKLNDYTELLMPDDLLSSNSILAELREAIPVSDCNDVEIIGWLYQFYISEKKDEVFDGLKTNKKISKEDIPAATELFTPHWIVQYLVENSLGRLWMENHPESHLRERMTYYIVDSGQWTVDSKHKTEANNIVDSGQWSGDSDESKDSAQITGDAEKASGTINRHGQGGIDGSSELPRVNSLAEGNAIDDRSLQSNESVSTGGVICADKSASSCGCVNPVQYCRRPSEGNNGGFSEVSVNSERFASGSRNTNRVGGDAELSSATRNITDETIVRGSSQNVGEAKAITQVQDVNSARSPQLTVHSPLPTAHSPLPTLHCPLPTVHSPEELRICDPCCGSGHMLVYAFDLLYAIYEECGYDALDISGKILSNNLFGLELDPRAAALAAFALTMKARQKQRRFLTSRNIVQPHICLLQSVRFSDAEMDAYVDAVGKDFFTIPFFETLPQFADADNLGSLIVPHLQDSRDVRNTIDAKHIADNIFLCATHDKVMRLLEMCDYLAPRYHVVVTNPPYMGSKGMNAQLKEFAERNYPDSKADLFAMFMERCLQLALPNAFTAMITMQSWMFLSSFEKLRKKLLSSDTILTMAHLGTRAFDTIGGEVVSTTAFVLSNTAMPEYKGTYIRLVDGKNEDEKKQMLKEALQ